MTISHDCTEAENALLKLVISIPNVTSRILKIAMRRLRMKEGLCATYNCPRPPDPGYTLCGKCRDRNRRYLEVFNKKKQLPK